MEKRNNTEKFIQTDSTDVGEPIQSKSNDGWNPISMKSPYVRKSIKRKLTNGEKSIQTESANGEKLIQMESLNENKPNPKENQIKKETINMEKGNTTNSSRIYTATRTARNRLATILAVWLFAFVALFAVAYVNAPAPFNGARNATVSALYSGGTGTETDPYLLSTTADFESLATTVNAGTTYSGSYFKMTADVTLPSTWVGIGSSSTNSFQGTFDGDGHIVNDEEGQTETAECGLFGYVGDGGVIRNVGNTRDLQALWYANEITTWSEHGVVGAICTYFRGEYIGGCFNSGYIDDTGSGGGCAGIAFYSSGIVENCYNAGETFTECGWEAGIVVANEGTVRNCYNIDVDVYKDGEDWCPDGIANAGMTNCFALSTLTYSDTTSHYYIVPGTNTDFKSLETYQGTSTYTWDTTYPWDFDNVWTFIEGENNGYPVLQAFYKTISFDAITNGGMFTAYGTTTATSVQVANGATFTIAGQTATAQSPDWSFVGWSLEPNSRITITEIESVTEDTTLYAVYKTMSSHDFYHMDTTTPVVISVECWNEETGQEFTAPEIVAGSGYARAYWRSYYNGSYHYAESGEKITLEYYCLWYTVTACWERKVDIIYDANDDTGKERIEEVYTVVRYGDKNGSHSEETTSVSLASNSFTRKGYKFLKWAKDSADGTQYEVGASVSVSEDTTFYAIWERVVYTTTFNIAFTNIDSGSNNIIVYLLRENSDGGYDEFYTYYLNKSDTFTLELTKNVEYKVLVSKPYAWTLSISGSNVTDGTFSNNTYKFTTSSDSGTISITTTGGSTINNFICI